MTDPHDQDARALARSRSWRDRADAARRLALGPTEPAEDVLLALLCDPGDTSVVQAAVDAVLERDVRWGADLIFRALAAADDELQDHLLYYVAHLEGAAMTIFLECARQRRNSDDGALRSGSEEALAYFHR
jgi:hypothetical protein